MTQIENDTPRPVSTTNAQILYIMHGIAPFTAWTLALIAVIIGVFARGSHRGTFVDSHYSYLARTFWWTVLWAVIVTFIFAITIVGLFLLFIPWGILTIWYLYRVIRGWLRLNDGLPAP